MALGKSRVLILGASGILGHMTWKIFQTRFAEVYATVRKPKAHYEQIPFFQDAPKKNLTYGIDLTYPERVLPFFDEIKPDVIVNCTGVTFRRSEANSYEANVRTNALLPHVLNGWCEKNGARLLHISTDCVFSGKDGGYTEQSNPDAHDAYGRSKAMGEVDYSKNALVIRTSIIGPGIESKTELLDWFLSQDGKTIKGFRKTIFSGVGTPFLARTMADIVEKHPTLSGLYQLASEPISKFDLLVKIGKVYGVNVDIVPDDEHVSRKNLNGSRFREATGIITPSWDEMLIDLQSTSRKSW
jgi:dTDP-4-dehydrorhamnose reductase